MWRCCAPARKSIVIEGNTIAASSLRTPLLSIEMCEAKDHHSLEKLEPTLVKANQSILNELSYLSFNRHQSDLLFKVISC